MPKQTYSWLPDIPDHRDYRFVPPKTAAPLPPRSDLRPWCPPIYDQGQLGSCTANAIAAAHEFDQIKQSLSPYVPSRLFIYYNERVMEGTVGSDAGAAIRDGIKSLSTYGVCNETAWPYNIDQFAVKPPKTCYKTAATHTSVLYRRINRTLADMQGCLAAGYPFVFGFSVYESFESDKVAKTGSVPMPGTTEQMLGGHAVMAVGYVEAKQRFIVRNSWGPDWALKGYFTMPYAYLLDDNLSDDFWVVNKVN